MSAMKAQNERAQQFDKKGKLENVQKVTWETKASEKDR